MAWKAPSFIRKSGKLPFTRHTILLGLGTAFGLLLALGGGTALHYTSTDEFCGICHVHPHVEISWKQSGHFKNRSGVVVHCVECHLPPGGVRYVTEKARLGIRDGFAFFFTDTDKIDWEAKSTLEAAAHYTFDESCVRCHQDLYSKDLTPKGVKAHEYYLKNAGQVRCINCHLDAGHWRSEPAGMMELTDESGPKAPVYPSDSGAFEKYTETIPGTEVTFNMVPIPGGTFDMGSPEGESCRRPDEGPARKVTVSPFWMGEIEVSWREYMTFFAATSTGEKTGEAQATEEVGVKATDAITGPTPPYGAPDQGWGRGLRPAITMSHHAAEVYCQWLSRVTGKKYRLPTEAEWEYACRAGQSTPYPFEGDPAQFTTASLKNRLFGVDDSIVRKNAWFRANSGGKTQPPYTTPPNAWGMYNMVGNVREFCSDWYAPDAYGSDGASIDPKGPSGGTEHVVRGGSFQSSPEDLRSAARDHTETERWLMTDPQSPKSVWWYSDVKDVGFRVVREVEDAPQ